MSVAMQREPRGTADAVACGAAKTTGDALVVMGDAVVPEAVLASLARAKGFVLAAVKVPNPQDYGALRVAGKKVKGIAEKSRRPPSKLVNTGLYRVPREALGAARFVKKSPRGELEFTDVVAAWAKRGAVTWIRADGWLDVGRPWDILEALVRLAPSALASQVGSKTTAGPGTVEPGVQVRGRLFVARGARVRSGVYVEGDVFVDEGADVGPNAFLRGPLSIGRGCRVGAGCEVKASVLLEGAKVPHLSYVGDSVLGEHCNLGAGTQIANLRHDAGIVEVEHLGQRVVTGRKKLGAIVGDGAKTGVNASLNPGTILGRGARVLAGTTVTGTVLDAGWSPVRRAAK